MPLPDPTNLLVDTLVSLHSPLYKKCENSGRTGFFFPPDFGFIPSYVRRSKDHTVGWAVSYIHELAHCVDLHRSLLGVQLIALSGTADILLDEALRCMMEGKNNQALSSISVSLDLLSKTILLTSISSVAFECYPTFYSISPRCRHKLATRVVSEVVPHYLSSESSKIDEADVTKFADITMRSFLKKDALMQQQSGKPSVHTMALVLGEKLFNEFQDHDRVEMAVQTCLDVDLTHINWIETDLVEIAKDLSQRPEACSPNIRLKRLAKNPKLVDDYVRESQAARANVSSFVSNLVRHPALPKRVRRLYEENVKENTVESSQCIVCIKTTLGDVFFSIPPNVHRESSNAFEPSQHLLSVALGNEALLDVHGYRRLPEDFCAAATAVLAELTKRCKDPNRYHEIALHVANVISKNTEKIGSGGGVD